MQFTTDLVAQYGDCRDRHSALTKAINGNAGKTK